MSEPPASEAQVDEPAETRTEGSDQRASRLGSFLFPETPRRLPGRRFLKIALRAAHTVCGAALLGAFLFEVSPADRQLWFHAAGGSGAILLLLDVHESLSCILQIRGLVVLLKIILMGCLGWLAPYAAWLLGGVVFVSVLISHAPADIRYHMVVGAGRISASTSKG